MEEVRLNIHEMNQVHFELTGVHNLTGDIYQPYLKDDKPFGLINERCNFAIKRRANAILDEINKQFKAIGDITKEWYEVVDSAPVVKDEFKKDYEDLFNGEEKYTVSFESFIKAELYELIESERSYPIIEKYFVK